MQRPPIIDPQPNQEPKKDTSWHNTIASFMTRRIRHMRASSNEWIRVHRNGNGSRGGGGSGGGGGWLVLLGVFGIGWLAYQIVMAVVQTVQAFVQGVAEFISDITPVVIVVLGLAAIGYFVYWLRK